MLKLCVAFVIISCLATLIESQAKSSSDEQPARLPFYQHQQIRKRYYELNGYKPGGRFPNKIQLRPSYYNVNFYKKFLRDFYNRRFTAFAPPSVISKEHLAKTAVQHNDIRPDGSYEFIYQTNNGIQREEGSVPNTLESGTKSANTEGSYAYTSPEGLMVLVNYVANEDGFRPVLSYSGIGAKRFINSPNPSSVTINKTP